MVAPVWIYKQCELPFHPYPHKCLCHWDGPRGRGVTDAYACPPHTGCGGPPPRSTNYGPMAQMRIQPEILAGIDWKWHFNQVIHHMNSHYHKETTTNSHGRHWSSLPMAVRCTSPFKSQLLACWGLWWGHPADLTIPLTLFCSLCISSIFLECSCAWLWSVASICSSRTW